MQLAMFHPRVFGGRRLRDCLNLTFGPFFDANDENGPLGARWITPYTTRFDIEADKLVYHDAAGRSVDYPLLAPGKTHDNLAADLSLTRVDEQYLALTRGHELLELFEKDGERFRLGMLRDRKGNQLTLGYDDQGRLFRIVSATTQVAFKYDDRSRIIEAGQYDANGDLIAKLARYTYYIRVPGKTVPTRAVSKRYFDDDFEPVE